MEPRSWIGCRALYHGREPLGAARANRQRRRRGPVSLESRSAAGCMVAGWHDAAPMAPWCRAGCRSVRWTRMVWPVRRLAARSHDPAELVWPEDRGRVARSRADAVLGIDLVWTTRTAFRLIAHDPCLAPPPSAACSRPARRADTCHRGGADGHWRHDPAPGSLPRESSRMILALFTHRAFFVAGLPAGPDTCHRAGDMIQRRGAAVGSDPA